MKRNLMMSLTLLLLSTQSWALFNTIRKYELKSDNIIYDGYVDDGKTYLYYKASGGVTQFDASQIVASTEERIDGIKDGDTVLIHTVNSLHAECTVDAVFVNNDINMFCDEMEWIKAPKGYGIATLQQSVREHYTVTSSRVEKDLDTLGEFAKDQVIVLKSATAKFSAGDKVRIIHLYASGNAIIEHSYRKIARASIPKWEEVVALSALK